MMRARPPAADSCSGVEKSTTPAAASSARRPGRFEPLHVMPGAGGVRPQPLAVAMAPHTDTHPGQGVGVALGEALAEVLGELDAVADVETDTLAECVAVELSEGDDDADGVVDSDADGETVAQGTAQSLALQLQSCGQPVAPQ